MITETDIVTKRRFAKEKPVSQVFSYAGSKKEKMGILLLGQITRSLRTIRNLKGNVYVVGGLVTEGQTMRDIDIVVGNPSDISKIKKALGKYASRAHFLVQKGEPPSPLFLKITGKEPRSQNLDTSRPTSKWEYAGPGR